MGEPTTDNLRQYLDKYQQSGGTGKVTIDNIRRILSSFFSWLEEENLILKSPVRRIHKVKIGTTVKETYSDEALEKFKLERHYPFARYCLSFRISVSVWVWFSKLSY